MRYFKDIAGDRRRLVTALHVKFHVLLVTQENSRGRNLSLICSTSMILKQGNDYGASRNTNCNNCRICILLNLDANH